MYLRLLVSNTTLFQMMFVSFDSNSTGVTRWAGNVNPSEAPAFTPAFSEVRVGRSLVICVMIGWLLFALLFFFFWPLCCLSFCLFLLAIVLSVLLSFSFGHCVVCPSVFCFWPLNYLSFELRLYLPLHQTFHLPPKTRQWGHVIWKVTHFWIMMFREK